MAASRGDKPADPRACAARVLGQVFAGRSLTEALQSPCVGRAEGPFVQALCYGVLRQYPRYPLLMERLLDKPLKPAEVELAALLQAALFQLEQMRVPAHAVLNESVQATRRLNKPWAARLVNAVLRRFQRDGEALQAELGDDPRFRHALPEWLLERLQRAWPQDWQGIAEASCQQGPLCLRVHRGRSERKGYFPLLQEAGLLARPHPFAPDAVVLERAVPVEQLPGFAEGLVSVQDAGAQLAALLLDPQPGERLLDACAAPGGKTCHLLEIAAGIDLVAVDHDHRRLQRVEENLRRLGLEARCATGDATRPAGDWAEGGYDRILLDAPCSATGVIRRHPDIKLLRRDADIDALAALQGQALRALWPLLRPGGRLLYATCSILPEENEAQVDAFLAERSDAREFPIVADWGRARSRGRQTLPGEATMDGFYYCLLEKIGA